MKIRQLLMSAILFLSEPLDAQNSTVPWFALSGGFTTTSAQSGRVMVMSAGQAFVGVSSNSNHFVESGFLAHPMLRGGLVSVPPEAGLPQVFGLEQNYPNPFNPVTTIEYGLPRATHVELKVYTILGQEVMTLVNEIQDPGYQRVMFDAGGLAAGVYFYRLEAGNFTSVKKLLLLK